MNPKLTEYRCQDKNINYTSINVINVIIVNLDTNFEGIATLSYFLLVKRLYMVVGAI